MRKTVIVLFILIFMSGIDIYAQCAMCRATVGSNLSEGRNTIGTGLNIGILYLLVMPYLIVGLGVFFYRKSARKRLREQGLI